MAVRPGFAPAPPELLSPHPKVWMVGLGEDADVLPKHWAPSWDSSLQGEGLAGLSLLGSRGPGVLSPSVLEWPHTWWGRLGTSPELLLQRALDWPPLLC